MWKPTWSLSASHCLGLAVLFLVTTVACSTSGLPSGPTPQGDESAGAPASSGTAVLPGSLASSRPQAGQAWIALEFFEVDGVPVVGFEPGTVNGVQGRLVQLVGDIQGINFEPGECISGVDFSAGFAAFCLNFGDGPGQFMRAHPGKTAFTTCSCTVAGVGVDDRFILKISYPPGMPPIYPFGFTKFSFQHGTGQLANLRGQGTLDFAAFATGDPPITFSYHFAGRPQ
jgi:hypothetical protein